MTSTQIPGSRPWPPCRQSEYRHRHPVVLLTRRRGHRRLARCDFPVTDRRDHRCGPGAGDHVHAEQVIEGVVNTVAEHREFAQQRLAADPSSCGRLQADYPRRPYRRRADGGSVQPIDTAVVRATGTLVVPDGAAFDLDSGRVGARHAKWRPGGPGRPAEPDRGKRCAAPAGPAPACVTRRALPIGPLRLRLQAPNPIGIDDLATLDPFGWLFGNNPFDESLRIYGVRTNEGRWAAVQAVEVTFDYIRFRYITWEKPLASVEIVATSLVPRSHSSISAKLRNRELRCSCPHRRSAHCRSTLRLAPRRCRQALVCKQIRVSNSAMPCEPWRRRTRRPRGSTR